MMGIEQYELRFNVIALKLSGYILPGIFIATKLQIIWFLITLLPFTVMDFLNITDILTEPRTLTQALIDAFHFVNFIQTHFRRIYFIYLKKRIEALMEDIKKPFLSESLQFDEKEKEMRDQSTRNIRRFSGSVFLYYLTVTIIFFLLPVTLRLIKTIKDTYDDPTSNKSNAIDRPLFVKIWWPNNPHDFPMYFVILTWQFLMSLSYTAINTSSDVFVCALMLAVSHRGSLLARTAPVALLPGRRGQITPYFRAWIKYHQHYLSLMRTFASLMGPFIFMAHFTAVLNIILESYILMEVDDNVIAAFFIPLIVGLLARILIYSKAGQQIINKSEGLTSSVMSVIQMSPAGSGPTCSALQVLRARCGASMVDQINVLGFFDVSTELFTKVLSASLTYLLVLMHLKKKEIN